MPKTKIEWTEYSWNPTSGCSKISEGCANCYAERMSKRLAGRFGYPKDDPFRVTLHPERLEEPLRWRKPRRVFVCSMGDLFHEDVPDEFIKQVFNAMATDFLQPCKHTYIVLTKRPGRMLRFFQKYTTEGTKPWPNVWLGVTAENQARADERIPILLQIPAAVRFVSCEPLLSAIDLSHWLTCACDEYWPGQGHHPECPTQKLHWCIVGGETGPNARPCHPDWVRNLRDQAKEAGVSFFFKSHGRWLHESQTGLGYWPEYSMYYKWPDGTLSFIVGKEFNYRRRLLDGRTWDEVPEV